MTRKSKSSVAYVLGSFLALGIELTLWTTGFLWIGKKAQEEWSWSAVAPVVFGSLGFLTGVFRFIKKTKELSEAMSEEDP